MSGKVIKTLTNIRYRRSANTFCQSKNTGPEVIRPKCESDPYEAYERVSDEYEERAAIMEFDGGLSKTIAEKVAQALLLMKSDIEINEGKV